MDYELEQLRNKVEVLTKFQEENLIYFRRRMADLDCMYHHQKEVVNKFIWNHFKALRDDVRELQKEEKVEELSKQELPTSQPTKVKKDSETQTNIDNEVTKVPHICQFCNASFTSYKSKNRHENHSCKSKSKDIDRLENKLDCVITILGKQPTSAPKEPANATSKFVCPTCNDTFAYRNSLNKHIRLKRCKNIKS